jgi:regulator of sigma E protease
VEFGLRSLLFFIGFISVNLAIVNLLPIPIADGGQILFFTLEKLRGRPLSIRNQMIIQQVSIVLLAGLFLYITFYDLLRVFFV